MLKLFNRKSVGVLVGTIALLLILVYSRPADASDAVKVLPSKQYQTLRGWEVVAHFWSHETRSKRSSEEWPRNLNAVLDGLVHVCGINRVRLEVRSGLENPVDYWALWMNGQIEYDELKRHFYETINDNNDPARVNHDGFKTAFFDDEVSLIVLPIKERLKARGEDLYLTLNLVDFKSKKRRFRGNLELAQSPEEYAEFVGFYFARLRDIYGIVPDALEITLEPENTDHWSGRQIGLAVNAATAHLHKLGFQPTIIAPSTRDSKNAVRYYEEARRVLRSPGLISVLGYHKYDGEKPEVLRNIAATAQRDGIETAMLELIRGGIDSLFNDLLIAQATAWQKYGIVREIVPGVKSTSDSFMLDAVLNGSTAKISPSSKGRLLCPVFSAFRQGAVRIGTQDQGNWLRSVAVRNRDGKAALAVRTSSAGSFDLSGLPVGDYGVVFHPEKKGSALTLAQLTAGSPSTQISVPGRGVVIVTRID
jgi:hypothetical protein